MAAEARVFEDPEEDVDRRGDCEEEDGYVEKLVADLGKIVRRDLCYGGQYGGGYDEDEE